MLLLWVAVDKLHWIASFSTVYMCLGSIIWCCFCFFQKLFSLPLKDLDVLKLFFPCIFLKFMCFPSTRGYLKKIAVIFFSGESLLREKYPMLQTGKLKVSFDVVLGSFIHSSQAWFNPGAVLLWNPNISTSIFLFLQFYNQ